MNRGRDGHVLWGESCQFLLTTGNAPLLALLTCNLLVQTCAPQQASSGPVPRHYGRLTRLTPTPTGLLSTQRLA